MSLPLVSVGIVVQWRWRVAVGLVGLDVWIRCLCVIFCAVMAWYVSWTEDCKCVCDARLLLR
jgi:hypothetical protein